MKMITFYTLIISCVTKQQLIETVSTRSNVSQRFFGKILDNVTDTDLCRPYDSIIEASFLARQEHMTETSFLEISNGKRNLKEVIDEGSDAYATAASSLLQSTVRRGLFLLAAALSYDAIDNVNQTTVTYDKYQAYFMIFYLSYSLLTQIGVVVGN